MATVREFKTPGVSPREGIPKKAQPSLTPSIGSFVGWTEKGEVNEPLSFRSPLSFRQALGGLNNLGLVAVAVDAYFDNGGEEVIVVRTVPADAVEAQIGVDTLPGPEKWLFVANGAGLWGNGVKVLVRGNENFLDRTLTPPAYTKYDVLVLEPSDVDPTVDEVSNSVNEVQFTDASAPDYFLTKIQDDRSLFTVIKVTEGIGGTPAGLAGATIEDEVLGTTQAIAVTLASPRVLPLSVRIVASESQIDDEAQTVAPAIDSVVTGFTFTLPTIPILDGSLRVFFQKATAISNEIVAVVGLINGANSTFTVPALALSDSVHREGTIFRLKYASGAVSGPNVLAAGVPATTHDLATTPLTVALPAHPGTVSISVDIGAGPVPQLDDGAGNFPVTPQLPAGGTINYDTGALTGVTAVLLVASAVNESHNTSAIITKPAGTDNLEAGVVLGGAAAGTIDLVDSAVTPTGAGALAFVTSAPPVTGTLFFLDFIQLGIVDADLDGILSGDGTGTVDTTSGLVTVAFGVPPRTGSTVDADYQEGQVVTDDGLGKLVGDVDATGNNTIDYDTGAVDFLLALAPLGGTNVLGNYNKLPREVEFQLVGGLNGSGVTRADITDPALEATQGGIYAMDKFEQPYNLDVPDFAGVSIIQNDLLTFAKGQVRINKVFIALAAANGQTPGEASKHFNVTLNARQKNVSWFYPNVKFRNDDEVQETLPASIFALAVFARTANRVNVGKNPAGVEDGALTSPAVIGLERKMSLAERELITQSRGNVLRHDLETGAVPVVFDGITTSIEARWNTINKRLLHMFLMFRITLRLMRFVHDNNGPALWLRIEEDINGFMDTLFRANFFGVEISSQAYRVTCSKANNNQGTIDQGLVVVEVGFTAGEPGRFIDFPLTQPVGQPIGSTL